MDSKSEREDMNEERAALGEWVDVLEAEDGTVHGNGHLGDEDLFDLASGTLPVDERSRAHAHLADCGRCVRGLVEMQRAIESDRAVHAVWDPKVFHAAVEGQSPPVVEEPTADGKYRITLQPARQGERDLLTLQVSTPFREELEGQEIVVVGREGTVIMRGVISGGNVTRFIDRKLRAQWPFRIHGAGSGA